MKALNCWVLIALAVSFTSLPGCCGGKKETVVEKQPVVVERREVKEVPLGDQLIKLKEAHDQGAMTDEEYEAAKKKLLAE